MGTGNDGTEVDPREINGETYPHLREDIRWRLVGKEVLILHMTLKQYHILNSVAATIWQLCDGETTVDQIADRVADQFSHDRQEVYRDTVESLQGLAAMQLVQFQ